MPRGLNDNLEFILIDPCNEGPNAGGSNYKMIQHYADHNEALDIYAPLYEVDEHGVPILPFADAYDFWCRRVNRFQESLDRSSPEHFSKKIKMLNGTLKCYPDDPEFYDSEFYDSEFFSDSAYSEGEFGDCG